ncbi:MAG: glycosyltransferase family 39 protein [Armatimonadota bacterium]
MHKTKPIPCKNLIPLLLILLIAAGIRLYRLGAQSIWGDESLTLLFYTAGNSGLDVLQNIWRSGGHPPFYFLIVHYWFELGKSEFMLRFPSVIFGLASIPVMYALTNRLFGRRTALFAASIMALSPIHIWYSQEARMYTLQLLLGLSSILTFVRYQQERRSIDIILYVIFSVLGFYTQIYSALLTASLGIYVIITAFKKKKELAVWVGAHALILLGVLPWLMKLARVTSNGVHVAYQRPAGIQDLGYSIYTFCVGYSLGPTVAELHYESAKQAIMSNLTSITIPMLIFGSVLILGIIDIRRRGIWQFWITLCILIIPAALAIALSIYPGIPLNARYILISAVPFWIILALGIQRCLDGRYLKLLPAAMAVIVGLSLYNHYFDSRYTKQDIRSAAEIINKQGRPGDAVLVSSVELGGPFIYYFKRLDIPYHGYPSGKGFVDPANLPKDMNRLLNKKKRVCLVLGRTWSSDPEGILLSSFTSKYDSVIKSSFSGVIVRCFDLKHKSEK